MRLFKIGDISRMFHLSVSSIRHYEELGLVRPEQIDPETGYRYYSTRQFEAFNTILYLRALGLPLNQIADFLQNRDIDNIEEKLRQKKASVAARQSELARIERKIDNRLRQLKDARTSSLDHIHEIRMPPCRIAWVDRELKIRSYHDMEEPTIRLAEEQSEAVIFLGKVGVGISAEHLCQGRFDQYDGVFLLLDPEDRYEGETRLLPGCPCVSLRFRGNHTEAPIHYEMLMKYIRMHGMEVAGFSREVTMIDYGITNDIEKFVTEITIPVTI